MATRRDDLRDEVLAGPCCARRLSLVARSLSRILLVEDAPTTEPFVRALADEDVTLLLASDPWTALDALDSGPVDLLLASPSLKTPDGTPVHRLLWKAHPHIASRTVFVANEVPPSARPGTVLVRPLTATAILGALRGSTGARG